MGLVFWVYLREPDGTFSKMAAGAYNAFQRYEAKLSRAVGSEVLVAELVVETENRKPIRVCNRWNRRYRLSDTGFLDQGANREETRLTSELGDAAIAEGRVIGDLRSARGALLQRRLETQFRWDPSAEDLAALASTVNRRAHRHLLGPVGLRVLK